MTQNQGQTTFFSLCGPVPEKRGLSRISFGSLA